ncbi:cysteine proteinase [Auriculariales sp. MPI-PUGE-AT-0066]|nr:cysteine proteinase [Auriculariales sp. MPI-PUGE-AT-0066]
MPSKKLRKTPSPLQPPPLPPPPPADAEDDGSDLMNDLLAQLDSREEVMPVNQEAATVLREVSVVQAQEAGGKRDSKARHAARQARKAAALADQYAPVDTAKDAQLEREAKLEEEIISTACIQYSLEMQEISPDGHCLFSAIADQLALLGVIPPATANYATTRLAASTYMYNHESDFLPFLPSPEGEDGAGATTTGLMTHAQFSSYCATIRDTGAWGGEPEIQALSRAYRVPIFVVQAAKPNIVAHCPSSKANADFGDRNVVRISYHRRMYGLGEHYNSLRPKPAVG